MQATCQPFKVCVAAILSFAWLAASSHCALASLAGGHPKAHSCCADSKPAKPPSPCAEKCCGGMAAPVQAVDGLFAPGLALVACLPERFSAAHPAVLLECPSGLAPPGGGFFVGFVLGRSLQALAPPVFVV
jgi:hypothetical protein